MLFELEMIPLNGHVHVSGELAEVLRAIDDSGLPYRLTPSGTCIEGEWNEVMPLIRRCHEKMREVAMHVITNIKVEDEADESHLLDYNVQSIEEKIGRVLRH